MEHADSIDLLTVVVLCGLGFLDDYAKITRQNSQGVQEFIKLWVQGALAIFVAFYLWRLPSTSTSDQPGDGAVLQSSRGPRRGGSGAGA